ncbi:MAG: single-stranded DNA-binding protein [Acidimicrobiia bacterium]
MTSSNTITLVGNVTREPELRFTPTGQANTRFGIAVNRRWQDRGGEWQEAVSFFDVVAWREMAENIGQSLQKGSRVIVTGRLEQRSYETKEGQKRSVVEVIADEVGPSLRWASVDIHRNERKEGQGGFNSAPAEESQMAPVPNYDEYGDEPF